MPRTVRHRPSRPHESAEWYVRSAGLAVLAALVGLAGCAHPKDGGIFGADIIKGDGKRTTRTRQLGPFDRVRVEDGVRLELTAAESAAKRRTASVTTDANLIEYVETRVEDRTLIVGMGHRTSSDLGYEVALSAQTPGDVTVTEGGRLHFTGERPHTRAGEIRLRVQNGGEVIADNLRADHLHLSVVRAADARLAGAVRRFTVEASRGAEIDAADLKAQVVDVRASTGADIIACSQNVLRGRLSFESRLVYHCNPKTVDVEVGGSAALRPAN